MIVIRTKNYSKKQKEENEEKAAPIIKNDQNKMVNLGKAGLGLAGAVGIGAGVEAGRSLYQGAKLKKDFDEVKHLKDNPALRKHAKKFIKDYTKNIPIPGLSDKIINSVRVAEKNMPKLDTIDKISTYGGWMNKASNIDRTVLNNAGDWAKNGVDEFLSKHSKEIGEDGVKLANKVPSIVRRAGKMGVHLKNAKWLGKTGAKIAGVSGLLYLNGRSLQQGTGDVITR